MQISGLQKTTLQDYPGKVAAIVFTFGCNFRCGFCHNPELVLPECRVAEAEISEEKFFNFLDSRKGLLDAVVITGGEPTIQADLPVFIKKIKQLGFLVKLDTNGVNPGMIESLIKDNLVDYWAMDIKNSMEKYQETVNLPISLGNIQESIVLIMRSGVEYEFRSTIVEGLHTKSDILAMAQLIKGAKKYFLQKFVSRGKLVDDSFCDKSTLPELEQIAKLCEEWVGECFVR